MAKLSPLGRFRAFDNNGSPLNGGKLYTYEAGTTTPKATYTDESATVSNANPVIMNSAGYADVWLGSGGYKFILKDSADNTLWTVDDISGEVQNAFGSSVTTTATNLNVTSVYRNGLIRCTAALTLSLLSTASAEEGFYFLATNASSGNVTIDPDGAETIDGASTYTLYPNDSVIVICSGTAWFTAFSLPVAGITTNEIKTSGASGVVIKNSGGTTVATIGASNGTVTALAGNLTLGGTLSGASITSNTLAYGAIASSSIASSTEIQAGTASKIIDAATLRAANPVLGGSVATTSGTSVDISTSIPSGVRSVTLWFKGVSSSGTSNWIIQLGSTSFTTSGYVSNGSRPSVLSSTSTAGILALVSPVAAETATGCVTLNLVSSGTNEWHGDSSLCLNGTNGTSSGSGYIALSGVLDRIRITTVGGTDTFDAGSIFINYA